MKDDEMLYCLIAFILGWLISRMIGDGFSVGGLTDGWKWPDSKFLPDKPNTRNCMWEDIDRATDDNCTNIGGTYWDGVFTTCDKYYVATPDGKYICKGSAGEDKYCNRIDTICEHPTKSVKDGSDWSIF